VKQRCWQKISTMSIGVKKYTILATHRLYTHIYIYKFLSILTVTAICHSQIYYAQLFAQLDHREKINYISIRTLIPWLSTPVVDKSDIHTC